METTYYRDDSCTPNLLGRRREDEGFHDEYFVNGAWRPTTKIISWTFGQYNDLDIISEAEARATFPTAAFVDGTSV